MTFDEFTKTYFPDGRTIGKEFIALCPAHPDKHPSLSITEGRMDESCFSAARTSAPPKRSASQSASK